ncbi:DUF1549 domain-containing protein [Pelagicoccus sp. SDUM812005]|uniref:DUF1549 domain-containing protein n=1 Tax=Pelagicoccus sp. SDUM812005 TaxID=3041257 RepID=UPI00280F6E34|nr:DUF1549 domain-containing protein [Pelagicoccus sp. SDUM812005]MDQ8183600.1 DUF1549 domain-containing protein [Pelagicoccus sp. SDUM812005]
MKALTYFLSISHLLPALATAQAERNVDFFHDVVPILKQHCYECHGGSKSKGGFSINTLDKILEDDSAVPGDADQSYFIELLEDPDPDYRMPYDGNPPVPPEEIEILKRWVNQGMPWDPSFSFAEPRYEPPLHPRHPELPRALGTRDHPIDRIVDAYLANKEIPLPEPLNDEAFLRRVSLDITGLLPSPQETRQFLADRSPHKRDRLIDNLLSRNVEYTEHWLTFWNDLLRNDYAGTGFITGGRKQISGWLYDSLKHNAPFDRMVRELIAPPSKESSGFIDGIEWRGTVSVAQSLPVQFSQNVSQSFLGINMKCASCHDSFVDRWTLAEAYGLAAIYSEDPLELYRCDKPTGDQAVAAWPFPEIGQIDPEAPKEQRLQQLAELFVHPDNGRVTRTIVNRLWAQLMGRGIVHPLDAMETEPWNANLLDWLAVDFQKNGYNIKRTLKLIASSQAYQSQSSASSQSDSNAKYTYHGPLPKRLTAEQFVDAVWKFTDSAPIGFDAPVYRSDRADDQDSRFSVTSSWIWLSDPPEPNQEIWARREFNISKPVAFAGIVTAAGDAFAVYLNGQLIQQGSGANDLQAGSLGPKLLAGKNEIRIRAANFGRNRSEAALFCALWLDYEDGKSQLILSDENWQVAPHPPQLEGHANRSPKALPWRNAQPVAHEKWEKIANRRVNSLLAIQYAGSDRPPRASLLKTDSLMRSLGRPNRDQIVTSRPNELTTLEAVDLSTSQQLIDYLQRGADKVIQNPDTQNTAQIIDEIYLGLLTRYPTRQERRLLKDALGRRPTPAAVTDLLWAITATPEFFIIR